MCYLVVLVPSAPLLQLEPLNCTSITARWQTVPGSVVVQGYRLWYHEEGQPERPTIQLQAQLSDYTISGLGESHSLTGAHIPPKKVEGDRNNIGRAIFGLFFITEPKCQGYLLSQCQY